MSVKTFFSFIVKMSPKTLEWYVKKEEAQPLSVDRLKTYMRRPGLKFIDYSKIHKDTSMKELLGPAGGVCILWTSPEGKIGHFTGLFRKNKKLLWFDPTGLAIHRLAEVTHNPFILQKKLEKEGHVTYNRFKYQQIRDNVQSCGRHVLCRWNMLGLSDDQYRGVMTHRHLNPDQIATMCTLPDDLSHWSSVK
jgi:hypothetical protein